MCSGNGRVDYLCMEPNGRTTALINEPAALRNVGQVKAAETDTPRNRADLRFADVNGSFQPRPPHFQNKVLTGILSGDGRADMIWTDKFSGDAIVWPNQGKVTNNSPGSSKFTWLRTGPVYKGSSRGSNLHFPSSRAREERIWWRLILRLDM